MTVPTKTFATAARAAMKVQAVIAAAALALLTGFYAILAQFLLAVVSGVITKYRTLDIFPTGVTERCAFIAVAFSTPITHLNATFRFVAVVIGAFATGKELAFQLETPFCAYPRRSPEYAIAFGACGTPAFEETVVSAKQTIELRLVSSNSSVAKFWRKGDVSNRAPLFIHDARENRYDLEREYISTIIFIKHFFNAQIHLLQSG
mmetsp:Transcript_7935/g.17160  ORF Transcript_7935/g.17160 Transcript_7935/m.17160 type:complete len:205 (+) Transcript_7935:110-724(+)